MKETRRPCLDCGIDCWWSAFDLTWVHMGWTVESDEQPRPHPARVETEELL